MTEEAVVRQVRFVGPEVFELTLDRPEWLQFVPGDCLALFAENGRVSRPYSIASGAHEAEVRFLVRCLPGGEVSPYLASRRPGDRVAVSPPFGWFRPGEHRDKRPFVFVATGTGMAPFFSFLRTEPESRPLACYYGVRKAHDLVDAEWLRQRCPVSISVSREEAPGCHHGRVTELLTQAPPDPGVDFYLCGLDAMIDEVTDWLQAGGVPIQHIHRECFFNASPIDEGLTRQ